MPVWSPCWITGGFRREGVPPRAAPAVGGMPFGGVTFTWDAGLGGLCRPWPRAADVGARATEGGGALTGEPVPVAAVSRSGVDCPGLDASYGPGDLLTAWPL